MRRALKIADLPVGTVFAHKTCWNARNIQYIGIVYAQYNEEKLEESHICVHYEDGDTEVFFNYEIPDSKMYILEVS